MESCSTRRNIFDFASNLLESVSNDIVDDESSDEDGPQEVVLSTSDSDECDDDLNVFASIDDFHVE